MLSLDLRLIRLRVVYALEGFDMERDSEEGDREEELEDSLYGVHGPKPLIVYRRRREM